MDHSARNRDWNGWTVHTRVEHVRRRLAWLLRLLRSLPPGETAVLLAWLMVWVAALLGGIRLAGNFSQLLGEFFHV